MMTQNTLATCRFDHHSNTTHKAAFLGSMDKLLPRTFGLRALMQDLSLRCPR